jgi:hypothetical protein
MKLLKTLLFEILKRGGLTMKKEPRFCAECEHFDPSPTSPLLPTNWGVCRCASIQNFLARASAECYLGEYPIVRGDRNECRLKDFDKIISEEN